jgi:hypothetical protein
MVVIETGGRPVVVGGDVRGGIFETWFQIAEG